MRHRVIQAYDRRDPIRLMCRTRAVSPAGYSTWRDRPKNRRSRQNRTWLFAIREFHHEFRETYGSPGISNALRTQGHGVGDHRVASSCAEHGF